MACTLGVLDPAAQHHIATAFAMDRHRPGSERPQTAMKSLCRREHAGMKLRVSAGQPDGIGTRVGGLIGERREGKDFGAGQPPAIEQVRVHE